MEIETILVRYNPWWDRKYDLVGILREKYLSKMAVNLRNNQIIFITGLRRVGKTTIIKQFIHRLINSEGVNPKNILFVSLDDPSFVSISIQGIIDKFREINYLSFDEKVYLFFDEVNYKDDFSRELKSVSDNQNVKIFASGSNSLQIIDKKAFLTGRVFSLLVYPLDFEEYLLFNNVTIAKSDKHLKERYFKEYLKFGGMPQYVLTKDTEYIRTLIEDIIYKDIVRTFNIRNVDKLKETFLLLCERVGKKISYNKLSKILGLNSETVGEYVSYFQKTFLFSLIQKYSKSLNERIYAQKKVYISDMGIKNVFMGHRDIGGLFESFVFNELSKRYSDIFYYYESGKEIDFIIRDGLKRIAVEVKFGDIGEKDLKFFREAKFSKKYIIRNYDEIGDMIGENSAKG